MLKRTPYKIVHTESTFNSANSDMLNYDRTILPVIKNAVEKCFDKMAEGYDFYEPASQEMEHQSRNGFIPFTSGGWKKTGFSWLTHFRNSGYTLPTNKLESIYDNQLDAAEEYSIYDFARKYPEIVNKLGQDNIDYHTLYDHGYGKAAEELSELSDTYLENDTIMHEVGCYYYAPDNYHNDIPDKHSIYFYGVINMESYHRRDKKFEDYVAETVAFNSPADLENKLKKISDRIYKFMKQ